MDLGNMFFTLGLNTKDFDKNIEGEIQKAKQLKEELQKALSGIKLSESKQAAEAAKLMAEANRENAAAAKLAAQAEREKVKAALEAIKLKQKEEELQNGITAAVQRTKEAQAQNARLILSSNGHLSITKRLLGEMGTAASMYFSIFTAQHLLESLIRIRGEFDMQYISLKAILQSGEQATKLFEQIKGLAVVSPFKFMDLTTYSKQLSAYQIPTNELFDTTKRLADLSSGLGVDMSRIILAYGQVRSAAFLRGQELRQFTEAGIPMVDELASKFTKLTGTVTTAGDVFKKISDRQVPFQMVKDVIDNLTSEGGKFYNMQEKQAESLKGKVSNLADQYDIMMNRIGESNDKTLKGGVDAITAVMQNSEKLLTVIKYLIAAYGVYKVYTMMQTEAMGKNLSALTTEEAKFRVKRANMLEEARLYRTLTLEEEAYMRHGVLGNTSNNFRQGIFNRGYSRLNQSDYIDLASNDRISKNEILRLGYLGKINQQSMMELTTQGKITAEEMKQVMAAREQIAQLRIVQTISSTRVGEERAVNGVIMARIALMKLGQGLMSVFSAIVNPVTIAFAAISAIYSIIQEHSDDVERMKEDAEKLSSDMKEEWNDIQKFISDHPIEIAIKGGQGAMMEYIKQYEEELKKILPEDLANSQIADLPFGENGKTRSIQEQLQAVKDLVQQAQQAKSIVEYNARALSDAADEQGGGFFSMSDGIIYNFNQFIDDFENYKKEIESLSREGISNGLSNPNGIISSWMKYNVKDANDLKVAVSNANVPMQKLVDMIKSMQSKSGFNLMGAFDIGNISKSFDDIVGPSGSLNTVMEQMGGMVEDFKNNLKDKNIDWASKQGHDIAETFKQKFMEQNNITDETQQTMFSFMFDENMYGKTDAAFSLLAKGMKQSADKNVRDVTNKFLQDGIWSDAMVKSVEKAKNDCISRFPMFKDELQKSWGVVNFRAKIETSLDAQKLQEWQIELLKLTKGKYEVEIKTATNIDDALKSIQDGYNNAKKFIEGKKALMIRIGYRFDGKPVGTGKKQWNFGTGKWEYTDGGLDSSLQEEYLQQEELKKVGDRLAKNGYIDGVVKTGRGKSGTKGSTTDKYTEALRRNYDDLKNAIQKYKDLLKSMGSDSAMDVIKKSYGFVISSRYLTDSGLVNLANDFIRKNIKKTDTAKGFRSTLTQDRTSANVELAKLSPDARSKSILDEINISKDQYKVYDDMFSKLGSAKIASIIAFGSETKPYENIIKEMKSKFFDLAKSVKLNKSVTLEELLGIAPENLSKQPEKIQEFVNKYKEEFKNMLSPIREQFINAISKTEDTDIKMVLNENLKKQIIDNIPELMKGASKDDISKYSKAIEDKFNNDNTKLKIEKIKQNMNWEDLFGDLGSLSMEQLFMLNNQLQKIVDTTKGLKDPTIMKEWVSKLNNVREAMAKLEPYKNAFIAFNEVRKSRKIRDDLASQIKSLPETSSYNEALSRLDYNEMERIKSTIVTINDKSMTYAGALELLIKDTESYKKAREKAAATNPSNWIIKMLSGKSDISGLTEDLSNIGKIISVVDENVKSMDKFRSDVGIGENTALGKTTRSISSLSGGISGAFSSLLKGDIFGSLGSLFNGVTGIFDVFTTDTKKEYEEDVRQHEKLASVWNDLIGLKKEYLNTGYTEDINKTEDEIKNIYTLEEESAKALGKEYLNAGHSWKHHSNGVNQKKGMSEEEWDQLEKWKNKEGISDSLYNSIKGGRMTGLFDLSAEQIRKLKEDAPTFFAKLDDDTQKYLNQVEESSKSLDDSLDEIKKKWTSTTVENISNGYASLLENMDDMTKEAGNDITKILRTAVINAFMQSSAMKPYIEGWYEKLNEFMKNDGKLDSNEIDTLKNGSWTYYDEESGKSYTINGSKGLLDNAKNEQNALKQLGLYSDENSSSLSGGIKGITEQTADILASYINAIRADVSFIRAFCVRFIGEDSENDKDVITAISVAVAKIEINTRKSAENTDWMKDWMNSITMVTSNGKTLRT